MHCVRSRKHQAMSAKYHLPFKYPCRTHQRIYHLTRRHIKPYPRYLPTTAVSTSCPTSGLTCSNNPSPHPRFFRRILSRLNVRHCSSTSDPFTSKLLFRLHSSTSHILLCYIVNCLSNPLLTTI